MKIKSGGGGIDERGKAYEIPETEIEVPDDYFNVLLKFMARDPYPKPVGGVSSD